MKSSGIVIICLLGLALIGLGLRGDRVARDGAVSVRGVAEKEFGGEARGDEDAGFSDLKRRPTVDRLLARPAAAEGNGTDRSVAGESAAHDEEISVVLPQEFAGLSTDDWIARLPAADQQRLGRYRRELESFDPETRRYICWAPGTPAELVGAYQRVERQAGLAAGEVGTLAKQFLGSGHWARTATDGSGNSAQGRPVTLTWSIVPDGTRAPALSGTSPSSLRSWLAGIYGGSATAAAESQVWFAVFQEAFDDLAASCGIRFVHEPNDTGVGMTSATSGAGVKGIRGDIRIAGLRIDGNSGTLAYAFAPDYGDVVFDVDDSYFDNTSNNSIRLRNVLTHELGHALGLAHVCPVDRTKLMEPFVTTEFRGAQFDEVYSLQRQYGDRLEAHGGLRDNDSVSRATPLDLTNGVTEAWEWLSIDDNSDIDHYSFDVVPGQKLTVRMIPSDPIQPLNRLANTYLEGAQNDDDSCTAGTAFDPLTQNNLALEVLGPDGNTVLASSTSAPNGAAEQVNSVTMPTAGKVYVKITGSSANSAQLYRMEVLLVGSSSVDLQLASSRIVAESNSGGNAGIDPGETVRLGLTVRNFGPVDAPDVMASLSGPAGFTGFVDVADAGGIAAGSETELFFTFAQEGICGEAVDLVLHLTSGSGYVSDLLVPVVLSGRSGAGLDENFDSTAGLPADWSSTVSGGGAGWAVSDAAFHTSPHAAFAPSSASTGESILTSPEILLEEGGGQLSFRHSYDMEPTYDGAVLEASFDGVSWFDLMTSDATVSGGDYNLKMGGSSAIRTRMAWTGNSGGFVTTTVGIPGDWAGRSIRCRWRQACDSAIKATGWYVDEVRYAPSGASCDPFRPFISLSPETGELSELDAGSPLRLELATPLPLTRDVQVALEVSGNAVAEDIAAIPVITLPAGQTTVGHDLFALNDGQVEGPEELVLTVPEEQAGYAPGTTAVAFVTITDRPYGTWASSLLAPSDLGTDPDADADEDGWTNLQEYLLGSDPTLAGSVPVTIPRIDGGTFELRIPEMVARGDAALGAETSIDLFNWTTDGVERTAHGFSVERAGEPARFLRLVFSLSP